MAKKNGRGGRKGQRKQEATGPKALAASGRPEPPVRPSKPESAPPPERGAPGPAKPDPFALPKRAYTFVAEHKVGAVVIGLVVGGLWVAGTISDLVGAKQAIFPDSPAKESPRPRLNVSPTFRVVEGIGVEARFPVRVTNLSESDVSGEALRVEIQPPVTDTQFRLEPVEHTETITASSPSGANQVFIDTSRHFMNTLGNTTVLLVELGTIAPKATVAFEAVAQTRPGQVLQLKGSTVPVSTVRSAFPPIRVVNSLPLPANSAKGDQVFLVREPDGGPPDEQRKR